jgi:hypothetical protein
MQANRRGRLLFLLLPILGIFLFFAGMSDVGRLLLHSLTSLPDDRVSLANRILAYNGISCPGAYMPEGDFYGEGTITLECRGDSRKQYTVASQLPCSKTVRCRWFKLACWDVTRSQVASSRSGAPLSHLSSFPDLTF